MADERDCAGDQRWFTGIQFPSLDEEYHGCQKGHQEGEPYNGGDIRHSCSLLVGILIIYCLLFVRWGVTGLVGNFPSGLAWRYT